MILLYMGINIVEIRVVMSVNMVKNIFVVLNWFDICICVINLDRFVLYSIYYYINKIFCFVILIVKLFNLFYIIMCFVYYVYFDFLMYK